MDQIKKLKEKKGANKMHPLERKAKIGVVHDMQKVAQDAMSGKLKGMNKVTVASNTKEGLDHGLDKAHDVLGHLPPALDDSHTDHENFEGSENEMDGNDGMDSFPDADDAHQLEANPHAMHMKDEHKEAPHMMAEGGEVDLDDGDGLADVGGDSADEGMMPNYDDMDVDETSAHLKALVSALQKKGLC